MRARPQAQHAGLDAPAHRHIPDLEAQTSGFIGAAAAAPLGHSLDEILELVGDGGSERRDIGHDQRQSKNKDPGGRGTQGHLPIQRHQPSP